MAKDKRAGKHTHTYARDVDTTSRKGSYFQFLVLLTGGEHILRLLPAGKTSFAYSCMQTRLMSLYNGNDQLASFMCKNR